MNTIRFFNHSPNTYTFSPLARLSAFQHEASRLFDLPAISRESDSFGGWSPALDLFQDKDDILVKVELPGMKKDDIALSFHDGVLTLSGGRVQDSLSDGSNILRNERFFGTFERTVTMPMQVDGTRAAASYEDGILTIILPKAEAAKPRQIEIGVK